MISIIIPTLNEEKCLEKSLKQFVALKRKLPIEIIVSDGGSNDNTLNIAKKYADKIYIYKGKKRQTIASGRNQGVKMSKGEILFITDADVIIPNKIDFFKTIINTFENQSVVAATALLQIYPKEETFFDKVFHKLLNKINKILNIAKGECQIIRRKSMNKVGGYNENIAVGEDPNLFLRLKKVGKIVFLEKHKVYHSPRRFRNLGYPKVIFNYVKEIIPVVFFKRSIMKEWPESR